MFELTATTETGARLVRLAETLAEELATRASEHDREASFPHDGIDALKRAGYFTAPIPVEYGGLGVTSVHDVLVASSRLARGDASVAIGVNMHLIVVLNIVRRWQVAVAAGDARRVAAFGGWLEGIVARRRRDGDRDQRARPGPHAARVRRRRARRRAGGSTAARPSARCRRPRPCSTRPSRSSTTTASSATGTRRSRPTPRASRSTATGTRSGCARRAATPSRSTASRSRAPRCAAASSPVTRRPTWTATSSPASSTRRRRWASRRRAASVAARAIAARGEPDARTRSLVAENAIELGACRATLSRAATLVDGPHDDLVALFAEAQAAKTFVNEYVGADRRPRARALRRRRVPQRPPARARVPRRPRRQLHAPARSQPRLRPGRRRRARPRRGPALSDGAPPAIAASTSAA